MDIPGLGLTQSIEQILINWLFGSSEMFNTWLSDKTTLLEGVPWLNSLWFNLLAGFPFLLALLLQIGAVSFVFLLAYACFYLVRLIKPEKGERGSFEGMPLDDTEKVRRRRTRRRRIR